MACLFSALSSIISTSCSNIQGFCSEINHIACMTLTRPSRKVWLTRFVAPRLGLQKPVNAFSVSPASYHGRKTLTMDLLTHNSLVRNEPSRFVLFSQIATRTKPNHFCGARETRRLPARAIVSPPGVPDRSTRQGPNSRHGRRSTPRPTDPPLLKPQPQQLCVGNTSPATL